MQSDHEFVVQTVGLLLIVSPSSAALNAGVSAAQIVQFQLSDGDNVTCISIEEQTSLKNFNGSGRWHRYPTTEVVPGNSTNDAHGSKRAQQTFAVDGRQCPNGTIPVRAVRGFRGQGMVSSVRSLRRKYSSHHSFNASSSDDLRPHNWALARINLTSREGEAQKLTGYKGTQVFINVWKPYVESLLEFSLAQLWLAGSTNGSNLNTIEVGYQASTGHYGDGLPRLFVYWTADDYNTTGWYDLDCPGFVQVSNKVLIGGSFTPTSRQSGQQYEIKLRVFKDAGTGDWWLQLNDENVGYWPKDLYGVLQDSANIIELGWGDCG